MSEFIKKLESISQGSGRAIGFGANDKTKTFPMILIACITNLDAEQSDIAIECKADALLYDVKDSANQAYTIAKLAQNEADIPWGVRLRKAGPEGIGRLAEAGCDFAIIDQEATAVVLQEEKMGKVLEIDISIEDGMLKGVGQLPLEALLVAESKYSGSLTINQIINYYRLTGFAGKHSLAFLPKELSDLEALKDAGIKGVLMELSGKDLEDRIREVQETIRNLPTLKRNKPKRDSHAGLPSIGNAGQP